MSKIKWLLLILTSTILLSPATAQMSGEIYFEITYDDDDDDGQMITIEGEFINTGNEDIDFDVELALYVSTIYPDLPLPSPDLTYIIELDDELEPGDEEDFEIELFVNNPAHKLTAGTENIITIWPLTAAGIITIWPWANGSSGFTGNGDYASYPIFIPDETATTTSILNTNTTSKITTFPSPSTGIFNVDLTNADLTGDFTIEVYNAQGKNMMTELRHTNNSIIRFNLSHLVPDLYFISIKDSNGASKYQGNIIITR